jgi:hypothetical protein
VNTRELHARSATLQKVLQQSPCPRGPAAPIPVSGTNATFPTFAVPCSCAYTDIQKVDMRALAVAADPRLGLSTVLPTPAVFVNTAALQPPSQRISRVALPVPLLPTWCKQLLVMPVPRRAQTEAAPLARACYSHRSQVLLTLPSSPGGKAAPYILWTLFNWSRVLALASGYAQVGFRYINVNCAHAPSLCFIQLRSQGHHKQLRTHANHCQAV